MVLSSKVRRILAVIGVLLIAAGVFAIARPLYDVWQRGQADSQALKDWQSGGSQNIVGAAPGAPQPAAPCNPSSIPSGDYAFVNFASLSQYGYSGVAGDGNWNSLHSRSMVHWHDSPAPGHQGNVIIAFHREPNYEHIDQMNVGDVVSVQDRTCTTFSYKITQRWVLNPSQVTQLNSTNGHDLTLITCTPWWQDYQRIVWRATLLNASGQPASA